jgi:hypothetical protein
MMIYFCQMTLLVRADWYVPSLRINRHNHKHNGALSCHGDEELHPHFSQTWAGHLQFSTTKSQQLWIENKL